MLHRAVERDGAPQPASRVRVLCVGSSGGHLAQLLQLRAWWERCDRMWVTSPGADVQTKLAGEVVLHGHYPTTRNVPNALRNLRLARRVLQDYRPDVVISTGAGIAFPFFLVAKLLGIVTVYLEVYDRIDLATMTGRLCYPLSDLFLLQWEEQRAHYPRGVYVGSVY